MKFLFLLLFLPFVSFAQIEFQHITLKEAKTLAKEQNKPIFVDVFATWCGPCKYMAATTFMDPAIGTYFNTEFINVKLDGEKEDGPSVMSEYGITAYPTLLFISAKGELIKTHVGAADIKTLSRLGVKAAHPDQDPVGNASKKYNSSKKKPVDLKEYITVLNENADDSLAFYASQYLKTVNTLDFNSDFDRMIFFNGENDALSPFCDVFLTNIKIIPPKDAHDAMVRFILQTHEKGIAANSFEKTETVIKKYYPYLLELNLIQMPGLEDLVNEFKMQFEAQQ